MLPYGGFDTYEKPEGAVLDIVLPVSVYESPKAKIFLKGRVFVPGLVADA